MEEKIDAESYQFGHKYPFYKVSGNLLDIKRIL